MSARYIELGDGAFVNVDQVSSIQVEHGQVVIGGVGYSRPFHADRVAASVASDVLLDILRALSPRVVEAGTQIVTYLNGRVELRYLQ